MRARSLYKLTQCFVQVALGDLAVMKVLVSSPRCLVFFEKVKSCSSWNAMQASHHSTPHFVVCFSLCCLFFVVDYELELYLHVPLFLIASHVFIVHL